MRISRVFRSVAMALLMACGASAQLKVHLYSPWAADPARAVPPASIMIQGKDPGYYPGTAMTAEGADWFVYTFKEGAPAAGDNFKFVNYIPGPGNPYSQGLTYDNNGSSFRMGDVFLTPRVTEVWIIPQGPGKPPLITDIPPKTKALYLFNPWPETAPLVKAGAAGAWVPMRLSPDKQRCNWYVHYFTSAEYSVSFRSAVGAETYGQGGNGDARAVDLSAQFGAADTLFLLPNPIPAGPPQVRTAFPAGVVGACSFPLAVTVRDFSSAHPDFEKDGMEGRLTKGMVTATLPADKKPAQGAVKFFQTRFDTWFRTDSANATPAYRNYETCRDLPMAKDRQGYWTYDSYDSPSGSFFPVDDFNRFNQTSLSHYRSRATGQWVDGGQHNFHFCMEMHANFTYRKGQVFRFSGDDDVWVYIDNKLSIDLGGTHGPEFDSVALDAMGLTAGSKYDFDLFFCERKTQGSNLLIQTSIFFEQNQSIFARKTLLPGSKDQYDILEIISGGAYCGATKGGDTLPAPSKFTLSGPSVIPPQELGAGTHFGGIAINGGRTQVTVDTSKVTGLRPGVYTVTFVSEKTGRGGTILFTVNGNQSVEFAAKPPVNVLIRTAVPVTVQAVLNGTADKRAEAFRLAPQAGLVAYEDSALTRPIAPGSDLATDPSTGTRKFWVSAAAPGTYKVDLLGGPSKAAVMDTYAGLVFAEQPRAAKPVADPAGTAFLEQPFAVTLSTATPGGIIWYTVDGTPPVPGVGTSRQYAGPIALTGTATVKAIAVRDGWIPSEVMSESYAYTPPLVPRKAWVLDRDGDGRIEEARVEFGLDLPTLPDSLGFDITDRTGRAESRKPGPGSMAFVPGGTRTVSVTFNPPFGLGITSLANGGSAGRLFRQMSIPTLAGPFAVDDSVAPIVAAAEVIEPDSLHPLKRVILTLSEPAFLPAEALGAFVFKREGAELAPGKVRIARVDPGEAGDSNRRFILSIDSLSDAFPIAGDSVALVPAAPGSAGSVRDPFGNAPAAKLFRRLEGTVPKAKPMDLYITFPNGSKATASTGAETALPPGVLFVGIGKDGAPLPGRCGACPAFENGRLPGPAIWITTPGPVDWRFTLFTNHGEVVARGAGTLTEADLERVEKANGASGIRYKARIVWSGRTEQGSRAATGAYILQSVLQGRRDPKTGAPGALESRRSVFGLLRPPL